MASTTPMLLLRLSFSPRRHQFTLSVQVDRMEPTKKLERRHSSCAGAAGRRSRRLERCATPQRSTVGHLLNGRDDEVVQRVWRAPTVSWPAVGAQVGRERPGHLSWIREREEPDANVNRNSLKAREYFLRGILPSCACCLRAKRASVLYLNSR